MRTHRLLTAADCAWLPDVFIPHGITLPPIVLTTVRQGQAIGGWWARTFLGFGHYQCGFWPDVADVGLYLVPPASSAHPLAVVRLIRTVLAHWEAHGVRRCQSLVVADWWEGEQLIRLVGFQYEGRLRECEPGKDYTLWGRVRREKPWHR